MKYYTLIFVEILVIVQSPFRQFIDIILDFNSTFLVFIVPTSFWPSANDDHTLYFFIQIIIKNVE